MMKPEPENHAVFMPVGRREAVYVQEGRTDLKGNEPPEVVDESEVAADAVVSDTGASNDS